MKISINLLPPEQKKFLHKEVIFRVLMEQFVYAGIIFFILLAGLFTVHLILASDIKVAEELIADQESAESYRDVQITLDVFKKTNTQVRDLRHLQAGHVAWTPLLVELTNAIPDTIRVAELRTVNTELTVAGTAKTRDDVVLLKRTLETVAMNDVPCFKTVVIPDEDLVTARDTAFSLQMTLAEECLTPQQKI